ncbi:MAG: sirohydrochlorin chelatase [Egibacteraceae bacterium]
MASDPALLLIAHGTRDPRGAEEMEVLVAHVRDQLAAPVANAWLEGFAEPAVDAAVAALVDAGADRVVSVPLLHLGAGHAKTDVPGALAEARSAHPGLAFSHGRVLGLHSGLFALARRRVDAVSPPGGRAGEVLVVAGGGGGGEGDDQETGERRLCLFPPSPSPPPPHPNGDLAKAARFLAEGTGHRWAEHCFAGVTWPKPAAVLRRVAAAGGSKVILFSWSLLAGLLEQRVAEAADEVARETGLEMVDAGRFGPDPAVADVVLDRYREALTGDVRANCDLCCYRVPLPGLEQRVGAPSGGGTGEQVTDPAAAAGPGGDGTPRGASAGRRR